MLNNTTIKSAKEMKTEEKTIKDWLNTLKEPYKSKALNNIHKDDLNAIAIDIRDALSSAFIWEDSEEGEKYWRDLLLSLENIEE